MGFVVPDLSGSTQQPLAAGQWEVRFVKFASGESTVKKTPYVQPVWKVTDEDAVDIDGEPYKRNLYGDSFWLSEKAAWRLKKFADSAGVELPEKDTEYDSLAEYAADLTELFEGLEGLAVTEVERYARKEDDPDDEDNWTGVKAVVTEYKF